MFIFLKKLFCNPKKKSTGKVQMEMDMDTYSSNIDYSYSRRMAYLESKEIYGCHNNDVHREYEYWDWRNE